MFIKILNSLLKKDNYIGILDDNRPQSEKDKDWIAEEVFAFAPDVSPFRPVTSQSDWAKYQIRNQDGSGSCVANTIAKMLEVKRAKEKGDSIKFSHAPTYINRVNKPQGGMVGTDALGLAVKLSSCKETDFPSENMSDAQLDALKMPANFEELNNLVRPTNYVTLPRSFDYVAKMINQEGCAMIWVDTSRACYQRDIPVVGGKNGGVRHSITGVDAIVLNGVEYIVIEDSWGKFGQYNGQRLLSREFFNDAVFFCAVLTKFEYDIKPEQAPLVKIPFEKVMRFGEKSTEVQRYQNFLKSKGLFPTNAQSTGFYGNVTAKATYAFQVKYSVAPINELDALKGKRVGQKTLNVINNNL